MLDVTIPAINDPINEETFFWKINRSKYRQVYSRDGRYLLRANQRATDPAELWKQYMVLTEVEEAFRNLKGDLAVRPIYHQLEHRIEAHIFVAFLAYCLRVTLRQLARAHSPGHCSLTPAKRDLRWSLRIRSQKSSKLHYRDRFASHILSEITLFSFSS